MAFRFNTRATLLIGLFVFIAFIDISMYSKSADKAILDLATHITDAVHLTESSSPIKSPYNEPDGHFSACLLTMDDHSMLDEWFSYHYFALKLRYVVVVVDPKSKIYPRALFARWRKNAPNFTIVEWMDEDFARNTTALKFQPGDNIVPENHRLAPRVQKHRSRQGQFYIACAKHLKEHQHTWTAFLDVDEFLSVNQELVDESIRQQPGHVLSYLQHLVDKEDSYVKRQGPCVNVPRSLHGGIKSDNETVQSHVPAGYNGNNFNTLRYIHRSTPPYEAYALSKSLLDVSALDVATHFHGDGHHPNQAHQPIENVCNKNGATNYDHAPLRVHHYFGTLKAFLWKDDVRRTIQKYRGRSRADHGIDDELRFWLQGFVELVGNETAQILLQDAGKLPKKP